MTEIQALILGIVQGLTEYLPVSSDGHLTLATAMLGARGEDNLLFDVIVHAGTALSSIVIFWKDIMQLLRGLFRFSWNEETRYSALLVVSMIPVLIVGLFFKDEVKALFISEHSVDIAGAGLIGTGLLLLATLSLPQKDEDVSWGSAFITGIAQAAAVLPGLSRSGSTIATGLLMGVDKAKMARFSFLMVIVPILGATLLDAKDVLEDPTKHSLSTSVMLVGFVTSFLVGIVACKAMIAVVKRGKIHYFGYYCLAVGFLALLMGLGIL